jgi:hypothetical protein
MKAFVAAAGSEALIASYSGCLDVYDRCADGVMLDEVERILVKFHNGVSAPTHTRRRLPPTR